MVKSSVPDYGIIYNWDGAPHGYSQYPQSLEQFLDKVYGPLNNTQVGALCWCLGVHEVPWVSSQLDMVGDSTGRRYNSVRSMRHNENIRAFFERGEDLYGALVQRGRELGIAVMPSLRMNDNHFWDLRPGDLGALQRSELTPLRQQHPEWLLGEEQAPGWASTSWNMAIPEVREYSLQRVVEACRLADWDGVELDWQRHAFHLPADDAYRLRYTLTDLLAAIRAQTEQIAQERGRAFPVAVRVATTFEACRRIGYDIERWVADGLCDIVITGGNSGTDPGAEVERFVQLCQPHGVRFYVGFDSDGRQQARRLRPHGQWRVEWFRGLARDQLGRGANGVYVFNWHGNGETHRPLLATMGTTEALKGLDKVYTVLHRSIGPKDAARVDTERDDRIYGEVPVDLQPTLIGVGPVFHLRIGDEVADEGTLSGAELQIEMVHWAPGDRVEVSLDGTDLGEPEIRDAAAADGGGPADASENAWLCWALTAEQVERGVHQIGVCLLERDDRLRVPLRVEHVEIYLTYCR
ncbi:MAG: hypothetical protein GKR89_13895 [Candidatus Latescibacteria bacterium]|nr:hypothetical protein [Candidatus Latescibacterota bacterium]